MEFRLKSAGEIWLRKNSGRKIGETGRKIHVFSRAIYVVSIYQLFSFNKERAHFFKVNIDFEEEIRENDNST